MLATHVPVIGTLDPSRAKSANNATNEEYTAEELDAMLAAAGADKNAAEVTGSSAKKGGKRRKA